MIAARSTTKHDTRPACPRCPHGKLDDVGEGIGCCSDCRLAVIRDEHTGLVRPIRNTNRPRYCGRIPVGLKPRT